jgi:ornithine carbamoyltransferase
VATTRAGRGLYLHCLPADISKVSCAQGEVAAGVFDRHRAPLYKQAGYKPYIIAAMILLGRVRQPVDTLTALLEAGKPRTP